MVALTLSAVTGKLTMQGSAPPWREAARPSVSLPSLLLPSLMLPSPDEPSSVLLGGPPVPSSSQASEALTPPWLVPGKLGKLWTLLKLS